MELVKRFKTPLAFVLAVVFGIAVGRFTTTPDVKIKTVEVEKKIFVKETKKKTSKKKTKRVIEKTNKDGTKTKEVIETEEDVVFVDESTKTKTEKDKSSKSETKSNTGRWIVSGMAGYNTNKEFYPSVSKASFYGVSVDYRILGPVHIGAFGTTTREVGVTLGLQF